MRSDDNGTSTHKLRGLLEASPDAVIVVDADGRIVHANARAGELFERSRPELIGESIESLMPEPFQGAHLRHRLASTAAVSGDTTLVGRRGDGSEFPAEVSLSPLESDQGPLLIATVRDGTHRVRSESALREGASRFRRIYDSAAIAVVFWTASGGITDANELFLSMTGLDRRAIASGKVRWDHLVASTPHRFIDKLAREAAAGVRCTVMEQELIRTDGTRIPVLIAATLVEQSREDGIAFLLDIAEQKRTEAQRDAALQQARRAARLNEMFMAMLGHDLRDPLNAVLFSTDQVLRRSADSIERPLARILSSTRRMRAMIDQLLDLSRARLGSGLELRPQRVDLAAVCERIVEELATVHPRTTLQLRATGDVHGTWDSDRLCQLVSNLIRNAVEHGVPPVRISVDGTGSGSVVLIVRNGGQIRPELLPMLFEPFRGKQQRDSHSRGLGLGLFIAREIVQTHRGTIRADSSAEEGTTFTVTLPRSMAAESRPSLFDRA